LVIDEYGNKTKRHQHENNKQRDIRFVGPSPGDTEANKTGDIGNPPKEDKPIYKDPFKILFQHSIKHCVVHPIFDSFFGRCRGSYYSGHQPQISFVL
jgi:hypothetical protein